VVFITLVGPAQIARNHPRLAVDNQLEPRFWELCMSMSATSAARLSANPLVVQVVDGPGRPADRGSTDEGIGGHPHPPVQRPAGASPNHVAPGRHGAPTSLSALEAAIQGFDFAKARITGASAAPASDHDRGATGRTVSDGSGRDLDVSYDGRGRVGLTYHANGSVTPVEVTPAIRAELGRLLRVLGQGNPADEEFARRIAGGS
jgi:hypothetical protein